ncbi:KUP/HAK/KT family potassium transporter [Pseudomonas putida]|uniref:KUP/HAK/KT family potassium transporter n=1 Tax=Pseudomonas putida TaxID=303 RepID=UPI003D981B31
MQTSCFFSRETVTPTGGILITRGRESLFAFLVQNAHSDLKYFKVPLNRVIRLGVHVGTWHARPLRGGAVSMRAKRKFGS